MAVNISAAGNEIFVGEEAGDLYLVYGCNSETGIPSFMLRAHALLSYCVCACAQKIPNHRMGFSI